MEGATPSSVTGEGDGRDRAAAASEDAPNLRFDISDALMLSPFLPPGYEQTPKTRHARRKNRALLKQDADLVYGAGSRIPPLTVGWIEDPLNP